MPGTNNFKAFATGGGANVISQAAYEALGTLISNGFSTGTAFSNRLNKVWRQSSFVASAIGQFIANHGGNALDDGNVNAFIAAFESAVAASVAGSTVKGSLLSTIRKNFAAYYDINSSSWADVTGFNQVVTVANQPVLLDMDCRVSLFTKNAGFPAYVRVLINGGEYADTVVDYTGADNISDRSLTHSLNLSNVITLTQNTNYTLRVQARNSTSAPTQNARINASNDFLTSADPDMLSWFNLKVFKN